jgi:hypothetical protein
VTPAGKVLDDIVSFADPYATFAELAGAKLPENLKIDGHSFAPQLRGEAGSPRPYAYVQLGNHWYVREPGYKLNEKGDLFDMSDAPFTEKPVAPADDTEQSKAARQRLAAALAELNPAAGKTDNDAPRIAARRNRGNPNAPAGNPAAVGPWKSGDALRGPEAPAVAKKPLEISADVESTGTDGVIVAQGGPANGYALFVKAGKLAFAVREGRELTTITAPDAPGAGHFHVRATLSADGALALLVNDKQVASGKAAGPIPQQPRAGFAVGKSANAAVADYEPPAAFEGKVTNVHVTAGKTGEEK